jgi:hypothetical protein
MKHILLLLLACSSLFYRLPAQTVSLNPEQVQRLAQLSKLYGHIKYFHRQLQQIGLQPKIPVKPTIKGIRAGKDEVLEAAIKYLSGK